MGPDQVHIQGVEELAKALLDAGVSLGDLSKPNSEAAQLVTALARQLAPRRTGALAGTGTASGDGRKAVIVFGSAAVDYAAPVHWGVPSRGLAARPFATDAREKTEPQWTRTYEQALERLVREVG